MQAWLSVWSEVQTCTWPSWCHCHSLSLASVKSRLVLPFRYRLTQVVPGKRPLDVCVLVLLLLMCDCETDRQREMTMCWDEACSQCPLHHQSRTTSPLTEESRQSSCRKLAPLLSASARLPCTNHSLSSVQLPSLYAHRSIMQHQVVTAGGALRVWRGHMARVGVRATRSGGTAPSRVQGRVSGADVRYGRLIWHQYTANSETWWLYLALYQQRRHHRTTAAHYSQ